MQIVPHIQGELCTSYLPLFSNWFSSLFLSFSVEPNKNHLSLVHSEIITEKVLAYLISTILSLQCLTEDRNVSFRKLNEKLEYYEGTIYLQQEGEV